MPEVWVIELAIIGSDGVLGGWEGRTSERRVDVSTIKKHAGDLRKHGSAQSSRRNEKSSLVRRGDLHEVTRSVLTFAT